MDLRGQTILVTGSAGFIGANLVLRLLQTMGSGTVVSLDNMCDYYDPRLKEYRLSLIEGAAEKSPVSHVFVHCYLRLVEDAFSVGLMGRYAELLDGSATVSLPGPEAAC
jgi:nucleoside-diphosphate-sugar epimerase